VVIVSNKKTHFIVIKERFYGKNRGIRGPGHFMAELWIAKLINNYEWIVDDRPNGIKMLGFAEQTQNSRKLYVSAIML
jgi:hypothetical protein